MKIFISACLARVIGNNRVMTRVEDLGTKRGRNKKAAIMENEVIVLSNQVVVLL